MTSAAWTIGTITLSPSSPQAVIENLPTSVNEFPISSSGLPVVIAAGLGAKTLKLQGELWREGYSLTDILGSVNQLGSYLYGTVDISSPYTRTNGTWLMTECQFEINAEGGQAKIGYSLEFKQGGSFLIL